jgi:tRNA-binding protein
MTKSIVNGGLYQHYKGMFYRVRSVCRHSETLEELVYYEALYKNDLGTLWVRPKEMFLSKLTIDGVERDRFALVDSTPRIEWSDFEKVELRVGTIVEAEVFTEARKPSYKLKIDFGDQIGIKKSSAQITTHYTTEDLIGSQVLAVTNFPEKQIGPIRSQVLTTGFILNDSSVVLLRPTQRVPNGLLLR